MRPIDTSALLFGTTEQAGMAIHSFYTDMAFDIQLSILTQENEWRLQKQRWDFEKKMHEMQRENINSLLASLKSNSEK